MKLSEAMLVDDPREVRLAIAHSTCDGDALDAIERRLIDPARLTEDEKSGLWLYAWASAKRRRAGHSAAPLALG